MTEQTIKCPHCKREIVLNEALTHQVEENLRIEMAAATREKEAALTEREKKIEGELDKLRKKELSVDNLVKEKVDSEKKIIVDKAFAYARDKVDVEVKELRERETEQQKKLDEARRSELELRKRTRALEDKEKEMDLELERKLAAERKETEEKILASFNKERRLKDLEKEKQVGDLRRTIEDLQRKAEQGSMQTQGEAVELDLEATLSRLYPTDIIEPVKQGARGADIIQRVMAPGATAPCGAIIWEIKNTKQWSKDWVTKLKDDQRREGAEIAVIVSKALPDGINDFGPAPGISGVWVTSFALAPSLTEPLRRTLIELSRSRAASSGKGEKMELLYDYMSGPEFKHRVEAIAEAFVTLQGELDREKRSMALIWKRREKQLERVIHSTSEMYGEMQSIVGATLPGIKTLELDSGEEEPETEVGSEPGDLFASSIKDNGNSE